MTFDTFNAFLVGAALLLLFVALYRADHYAASLPPPKNPLGFS